MSSGILMTRSRRCQVKCGVRGKKVGEAGHPGTRGHAIGFNWVTRHRFHNSCQFTRSSTGTGWSGGATIFCVDRDTSLGVWRCLRWSIRTLGGGASNFVSDFRSVESRPSDWSGGHGWWHGHIGVRRFRTWARHGGHSRGTWSRIEGGWWWCVCSMHHILKTVRWTLRALMTERSQWWVKRTMCWWSKRRIWRAAVRGALTALDEVDPYRICEQRASVTEVQNSCVDRSGTQLVIIKFYEKIIICFFISIWYMFVKFYIIFCSFWNYYYDKIMFFWKKHITKGTSVTNALCLNVLYGSTLSRAVNASLTTPLRILLFDHQHMVLLTHHWLLSVINALSVHRTVFRMWCMGHIIINLPQFWSRFSGMTSMSCSRPEPADTNVVAHT